MNMSTGFKSLFAPAVLFFVILLSSCTALKITPPEVNLIKVDVQDADLGPRAGDRLDRRGNALRDRDAACADAHERQVLLCGVVFEDFVGNTPERGRNRIGVHQPGAFSPCHALLLAASPGELKGSRAMLAALPSSVKKPALD